MTATTSAEQLTLHDGPASTAELRAALDRLADAGRLSAEARFDLKVAATEALANALKRSASGGCPVDVRIERREDAVEVEVKDRGSFRIDAARDPERGRGIPLMVALVDELEFASSGEGTRVRMRKRIAPVCG